MKHETFKIKDYRMLIGGKMVESMDGRWLESYNPANEALLGRVPYGSKQDMTAAIDAATAAQPAWAALSPTKRADYLRKLADAFEARADEFGYVEALDTGNTIGPMVTDIFLSADRMRYFAGMAYEIKGSTHPGVNQNIHMTVRVPYGVVGRIIPFNHPVFFAASRLAPTLIAGNAIVIKPPETSSITACMFAELCNEILPAGVVNIVTGGRDTGEALVRDERVKRIAFVGSMATGMAVQRAAAETSVKHVTLELGGKNPLIVFPDSDLDLAAAGAIRGMNFQWQSQSCGSTSRLLVHSSVHDVLVEKVAALMAKMKIGDPVDPSSNVGPMNSKMQYDKVLSYLKLGKEEGARVVTGGGTPTGPGFEKGYWIQPTLFADVTMSMRIAREEIFGPLLSVLRWDTPEEAIRMANDVQYGLTASIYTKDVNTAMKTAQQINAAYIWINEAGPRYRGVPRGAFKNSGVGVDEGIDELLSYTELKTINVIMN